METYSCQWCPVKGQEERGTHWKMMKIRIIQWGWWNAATGCAEWLWSLHPWRCFWAACSNCPCLSFQLDNLQRSLSNLICSVILCSFQRADFNRQGPKTDVPWKLVPFLSHSLNLVSCSLTLCFSFFRQMRYCFSIKSWLHQKPVLWDLWMKFSPTAPSRRKFGQG